MMSLTNRERVLLTILGIVITVGAFLYFLVFPMIDRIKENSLILDQERAILENLHQANQTGKLTELEAHVQSEIERIEATLPTQIRIPELYIDILSIADDIGIQQESFTVQNTKVEKDSPGESSQDHPQKEDLLIIPMSHKFKGTYRQIERYMEAIQENERKIDIIEYQLMVNNSEDDISANFLLQSYGLYRDGQNISEFVDYDFVKGSYGKDNPFSSGAVQEEDGENHE